MWSTAWLRQRTGALARDAVVIAFDWPSQRVYRQRRPRYQREGPSGLHRRLPPGTVPARSSRRAAGLRSGPELRRPCGSRALHLLGGGSSDSQDHDPPIRLPARAPTSKFGPSFWLQPWITTGSTPTSGSTESSMLARACSTCTIAATRPWSSIRCCGGAGIMGEP